MRASNFNSGSPSAAAIRRSHDAIREAGAILWSWQPASASASPVAEASVLEERAAIMQKAAACLFIMPNLADLSGADIAIPEAAFKTAETAAMEYFVLVFRLRHLVPRASYSGPSLGARKNTSNTMILV